MCESALHCISKLADNPLNIYDSLLQQLIQKLPLPFSQLQSNEETLSSARESETEMDTRLLTRLINFAGLVATKLLIFLNQTLVCELKRRKMYKENIEKVSSAAAAAASLKSKANKRKSLNPSKNKRKSLAPSNSNQLTDHQLEEEMGLEGAEAEDAECMYVEALLERKMHTSSSSLLSQLLPFVMDVLKQQNAQENKKSSSESEREESERLQMACAMCLIRCMSLSLRLCEDNLQFVFTLLEKSPHALLRSQLILGIGDLVVYRFPNAIEPWTKHLYLPLRDSLHTQVRMNTIRVLSHLILKEMIKTRGQAHEIALCIVDPEASIAALAKLFFSGALAKKQRSSHLQSHARHYKSVEWCERRTIERRKLQANSGLFVYFHKER